MDGRNEGEPVEGGNDGGEEWPKKKGRKESRERIAEKEEMQERVVEA